MITILLLAALTLSAGEPGAPGPDLAAAEKKRLELYLRERTERIKELHKAQLKFMEDEAAAWRFFWNKVRDERLRFEVHVARQRLNLFESLSSLDPRDHPSAVADFDKLQAKLIDSFEQTQRTRAADFFLSREERLKTFAAQQERDRQELQSGAESAWRAQTSTLRAEPDGARDRREDAEEKERQRLEKERARAEKERLRAEKERERERARAERQREKEQARDERRRQEEERPADEPLPEEEPPVAPKTRRKAGGDDGISFGPP